MASKKPQRRATRSASGGRTGSRKGTSSRSRAASGSGRKTTSSRTPAKPRKRSGRRQPTQPKSTVTHVVRAVRTANRPAVAAAATATVLGGVALRARKRSRGLNVHGVVKQIGKISKSVGKTSKQVSKDVHQLGDDVERAGKALS
jgi:hypothetical protein